MDICLLGYGKMGKAIDNLANKHNVNIKYRISSSNAEELDRALSEVDVVIEFTRPDLAVANIKKCVEHSVPVVCGTTGWLDRLEEVKDIVTLNKSALIYASNFSLGVNLFFQLNKYLAKMMSNFEQYRPIAKEIHHLQKLDKPSGTALSLVNQLMDINQNYNSWSLADQNKKDEIFIDCLRSEGVVGTHYIKYESPIDNIEIKHEAYSRDGFAEGAILAAKWLQGKQGVFTMEDFLNLKQ